MVSQFKENRQTQAGSRDQPLTVSERKNSFPDFPGFPDFHDPVNGENVKIVKVVEAKISLANG